MGVQVLFWEIAVSWNEEEGDGDHTMFSFRAAIQAPKCVPNLKPNPQAKGNLRQVKWPPLQKDLGVCLSPLSMQCQ